LVVLTEVNPSTSLKPDFCFRLSFILKVKFKTTLNLKDKSRPLLGNITSE